MLLADRLEVQLPLSISKMQMVLYLYLIWGEWTRALIEAWFKERIPSLKDTQVKFQEAELHPIYLGQGQLLSLLLLQYTQKHNLFIAEYYAKRLMLG